jgi:radical SAM protein with 4Fe4S-binding SPASM domain
MADAGVAYIALSGGEPLSRRDFWEIAKRMKEREVAFSIATNGTMLTKENVARLKEMNCLFAQISLDGANPATHNHFRGVNSFERTVEGIKNMVESGIAVGIATTVTKLNYKEVPAIIDLAESLGAQIFMHYNFIPVGRGKEIADLDLTPEERESLLNTMAKQIGKRKISLLSTAPQYSRVCDQFSAVSLTHFDNIGQQESMKDSVKFLADFVGGCGTGRLYCALDYNGDITPCVFIPIKLGNIRNDDFLKVWHDAPELKVIRSRGAFVRCGTCNYKATCGGCRARAYSYYGDLAQCDPGCILNKDEWTKLTSTVAAKL